jgi:hypothetical protein
MNYGAWSERLVASHIDPLLPHPNLRRLLISVGHHVAA